MQVAPSEVFPVRICPQFRPTCHDIKAFSLCRTCSRKMLRCRMKGLVRILRKLPFPTVRLDQCMSELPRVRTFRRQNHRELFIYCRSVSCLPVVRPIGGTDVKNITRVRLSRITACRQRCVGRIDEFVLQDLLYQPVHGSDRHRRQSNWRG